MTQSHLVTAVLVLCILVFLVINIFKAPNISVFIGLILLTWKQPVALFTFLGSLSSLSSHLSSLSKKKTQKTTLI